MAKLSGSLSIQAGDRGFNLSLPTSDYDQIFNLEQTVDNNGNFAGGIQFDPTTLTLNSLKSAQLIVVNNPSTQPAEIQFKLHIWASTALEFNDATCDYNDDPTITHDANALIKTGLLVSGTGIPANAMIGVITDTTHFELALKTTGAALSTTGGNLTNQTLTFSGQADDTGSSASDFTYPTTILRPNEFLVLPNNYLVSFSTNTSAGNQGEYTLTKATTGYAPSGLVLAGDLDSTTDTQLYLSGAVGAYAFQVGDIIQLGQAADTANNFREVMEVVSLDSATHITVKRAQFGTPAGDGSATNTNIGHSIGASVFFSYYNTTQDVGNMLNGADAEIIATDTSGRFASKIIPLDGNLQGLRNTTNEADGLVRGSVAIAFYTKGGYQELGMSGITSSTESGLTASTAYEFDIQVDGGTNFDNLSFTTSSNTKFGSSDGILRKIQDALDVQYYTAGNLFKKSVTVSIVNGDIRFTSNTNWSTSAIALTAGSTGTAEFFGTGRIPAVADIEAPVPSSLPDTTIVIDGKSAPNVSAFAYDDGYGNIYGACTGKVDYASSAITLNGSPANAEFAVAFNYDSALSVGNNANAFHTLRNIVFRSVNQHQNANIQILAFN